MYQLLALLCVAPAHGGDALDALLADGPILQVETDKQSALKQVKVIGIVNAPVDRVWEVLTNFEDYVHWMPAAATISLGAEDTETEKLVTWGVQIPGPNVAFTGKYTLDPDKKTVKGTWVEGALEGSHWEWALSEREDGTTLVTRTSYTHVADDHWLVRQFDDRWSSLSLGMNTATPYLEMTALQTKAQSR